MKNMTRTPAQTATNNSPVIVYPKLTINGPTAGTSRIYSIRNYTSGITIGFDRW